MQLASRCTRLDLTKKEICCIVVCSEAVKSKLVKSGDHPNTGYIDTAYSIQCTVGIQCTVNSVQCTIYSITLTLIQHTVSFVQWVYSVQYTV